MVYKNVARRVLSDEQGRLARKPSPLENTDTRVTQLRDLTGWIIGE